MVNLPGRDRRRRILKDEILSASNNHASLRTTSDGGTSGDAPRYTDAAGVENHPQITDFIPRRYPTIAILVMIGAGLTTAMAALHDFARPIAAATGLQNTAAIEFDAYGSLSSWLAAVVLLMASATCLLTYSIRRHRIDDYRGRYRVWLGAALACFIVSANSVAGLHQVVADVLMHVTGWSALRDGAMWWLVLAGLPITWIVVRSMLDMRECRVATALLFAAVASYSVSAAAFLDLTGHPSSAGEIANDRCEPAVGALVDPRIGSRLCPLRRARCPGSSTDSASSHNQAHREIGASQSGAAPSTSSTTKSAPTVLSATGYLRSTIQAAKTPADSSCWVDGSRPERDRYDATTTTDDDDSSGDDRKLSKSDRKRLRKLKAQGRAA